MSNNSQFTSSLNSTNALSNSKNDFLNNDNNFEFDFTLCHNCYSYCC